MSKIILVRSSRVLIEKGYVGYGWKHIEFRKYRTVKKLIESGFKDTHYGRKRKQIQYFYELKKDDIVVVPVSGAIAIGKVEGTKEYEPTTTLAMSENRVKVDFFRDEDNNIMYIPREELPTNLARRLKIRTSIANLEDFREEILIKIEGLEKKEIPSWDSEIIRKEEETKKTFIQKLEERLRTEKGLGLKAGGYGLELLIREIFEVKGFEAIIPAKHARSGEEDVDIIASKRGEFSSKGERYLIQAKHHRGTTSRKGLDQLIAYEDEDNHGLYFDKKILITTAVVDKSLKEEAEKEEILIIEGHELSEWIFENLSLLSSKTIRKLGISFTPSFL
jgi:restriction system protein